MLADEPTGNLDDATGGLVLDLLDRVTRQAGKTLVLVTHSREVAARADRVLTDRGRASPRVFGRLGLLSPTLLRTGLRDLVRRPLHTGLLVLGVALGVAVVIAIDLANESARRGFDRSSEAIDGPGHAPAPRRSLGRAGGLVPPPARRMGLPAERRRWSRASCSPRTSTANP